MILRMRGPDGIGDVLMPGIVPKFEESPGEVRWLGGPVGEHTTAVLRELAGTNDEEIGRLAAMAVIGLGDVTQVGPTPAASME
jgi:crotonobetainyl-CoA:carnitine CoA-transferase CaiB-like acyl-CoA transferase